MIHIEPNFHARETPTRNMQKCLFTFFQSESFARSVDSNGRSLMMSNNNMRLEVLTQTYRVHVMTNNLKCIKSISRV